MWFFGLATFAMTALAIAQLVFSAQGTKRSPIFLGCKSSSSVFCSFETVSCKRDGLVRLLNQVKSLKDARSNQDSDVLKQAELWEESCAARQPLWCERVRR